MTASSRFGRRAALASLLGTGVWFAQGALVRAATPSPEIGGDPRSSGQGPGLVGEPGLALLAVIAIGLASLLATLVYIRLTGGRRT